MNGIRGEGFSIGFRANTVIQLGRNEPIRALGAGYKGGDVVLAAVSNPPRIGGTRPIAALLPEVLARYGLADSNVAAVESGATCDVTA